MSLELGAAGLRFEREGPVAWCIIDRPEARNALTPAMYFGIKRAVRLVNSDPDLAALIITGTGDVFAPGVIWEAAVRKATSRHPISDTTSCPSCPSGTAVPRSSAQ